MPGEPDVAADDRDLLGRFVQGDQAAFERLFRQFEADVYGWIVRIVRDRSAADDVLVEAFWRAYRGRAQFDATRSFGAWMRRIATNVALGGSPGRGGPGAGRGAALRGNWGRARHPRRHRQVARLSSDAHAARGAGPVGRTVMTHDDDLLRSLLRAALPPVDGHAPSRDLWLSVVQRTRQPARWSAVDSSIAAVIVVALLMFPKWFWFLAYHL